MSAAFDTVDHDVLVTRLEQRFGVTGCAIAWTRALLRLERTMNSLCHWRDEGRGGEGRGVPLVILAIFFLNIYVARY